MTNYYTALGVSENAAPEIIRIAYEGRLKALAKAGVREAERKAEEDLLERAFETLSNESRRAAYDAKLDASAEQAARGSPATTFALIGITVAVLVGGTAWYMNERSSKLEQIRFEEARIAREADELERRAATDQAEKERRDSDAAYAREMAQRREEQDRHRVARERMNYEREVVRAQAAADREAERLRNARQVK